MSDGVDLGGCLVGDGGGVRTNSLGSDLYLGVHHFEKIHLVQPGEGVEGGWSSLYSSEQGLDCLEETLDWALPVEPSGWCPRLCIWSILHPSPL